MTLKLEAINLKDIAILMSFVLASTGFYFTTSYRLSALEQEQSTMAEEIGENEYKVSEINDRLIRIEENLAVMVKAVDSIERTLRERE